MNQSSNGGYIAIVSAIVISVLILAVTLTLGFTGFFGRFNILDAESKERSSALAEACADNAILKLSNDKDYVLVAADHTIAVGTDTCNIVSFSPNPPRIGSITIKTQAIVNKAYTNLIVVVDSSFNIVSWQEAPTF